MSDKVDKPKKSKSKPKAKAKKDEHSVLAALPSTRAERIGTRRASAPKTFAAPAAAQAAAEGVPAERAAKPASKRSARAKPAAGPAASKPAPKKSAKAKPAAAPAASKPASKKSVAAAPPPLVSEPRPRAVREGAPGIGTRAARDEPAPAGGRPGGVELVSTAVQAVGELTQAGLKVGGRVVKRAVNRLPKP